MKEIRPLTGIRGAAALLVVLYHLFAKAIGTYLHVRGVDFAFPTFLTRGYVGVDLFFILSGFLLFLIYEQDFDAGVNIAGYTRFFSRRIARVYPAYIVMIFISYVEYIFSTHSRAVIHITPIDIAANVIMVQNWWPTFSTTLGVSWSLSAEILAYLSMPFALFGLRSMIRWNVHTIVAISVFLLIVLEGLIRLNERDNLDIFLPPYSLLRCFADFYLGGIALQLLSHYQILRRIVSLSWVSVLSVLFVAVALQTCKNEILIIISFVFLVSCLSGNSAVANILFGNRIIFFFGEISYSLYLVHTIIIPIVYQFDRYFRWGSLVSSVFVGSAITMGIIIAAATISYMAIERPTREWFAHWRKGRTLPLVSRVVESRALD
jgi:peptidoglycan/LPS O-acetylase OafA/YrhL